MINEQEKIELLKKTNSHKFCTDPMAIEISENAITAYRDGKTIVCHHRREIEENKSKKQLIAEELYYNRPAVELIILSQAEHASLHYAGNTYKRGKTPSEFGRKFFEKYGITRLDNLKLYNREVNWYRRHGHRCRWEMP